MLPSPPRSPVDVVPCPRSDDVWLLPAMWPVRLSPAERRELAQLLLAYDEAAADES
ncbi:hypothetical protein GCM10009530_63550 [Microbispora corallina]|uniref:Uncharacterized protein n=1 Tax=Microbispora corallina TaxID=83302 RepID=A0ABQ4GBJ8_9ACTN|nr:hypothetical protein [Microbispora corallina]GIH44415.1 hypothetical protein Mco01_74150 [Microbispora corallina]